MEILRERPTHMVCRVVVNGRFYVRKSYKIAQPVELYIYKLLARYHVPTLPVHEMLKTAILLEDLAHSPTWRLANESDHDSEAVGTAVADWYRTLHKAGFQAIKDGILANGVLSDWISILNCDTLIAVGKQFNLTQFAGWQLAIEQLEPLKSAFRQLPQTFNYDDFAFENLALSRKPGKAIVFDYDQFQIGPVYADWRNVIYGLRGRAKEAFIEQYGAVDMREQQLDTPLSILHGVVIASQRKQLPSWAKLLLRQVKEGKLEDAIRKANA